MHVKGELRHVRPAKVDCAGGIDPGQAVCGELAEATGEYARTGGEELPHALKIVFSRHRYAVQCAHRFVASQRPVGCSRGLEGKLRFHVQERIELAVFLLYAREAQPGQFGRGNFAPANRIGGGNQ